MIVSHRHRFIFIKTRKTAGTSIEIALSRYCGPDDILTPISDADQVIRDEIGAPGPQNHTGPLYRQEPKDIANYLLKRRDKPRTLYWKHQGATHLRKLVGSDVWDGYYKFAFDRNPWDKVVSAYYWRHRNKLDVEGDPPITFAEYVARGKRMLHVDGYEQYSIDDQVAVDFVGKYESLEDDLASALDVVGIEYDRWLPNAKSKTRKNRDYRAMYGDAERNAVAQYFSREIEMLGYEF